MTFSLAAMKKSILLAYCPWVQPVESSNVLVGQGHRHTQLCVWYNIVASPDKKTGLANQRWRAGAVLSFAQRVDVKTVVLAKKGPQVVAYPLEDAMIEFASAIKAKDFARAALYLESHQQQQQQKPNDAKFVFVRRRQCWRDQHSRSSSIEERIAR